MADHEPRHKRGKMDASTSQSSEVNETQEPSAGAQFLEPQIYAEIKARMNVPTIYYKAICLVGSKGVGKTTLLYQLYETYKKEKKGSLYYDFNQRRCWVPFEQQVTKLIEDTKSGDYQWLFIDNVQLAKGHEYAEGIICTYVKQPLLPCVYKDNKEVVDKWLTYTGYRLGEVSALAKWVRDTPGEDFIAKLDTFKGDRETAFGEALAVDQRSFPEHTKDIFVKCVTLCIGGSGVPKKALFRMYKMPLERLPWTLLKMTSDCIEAVSPQAQFVLTEFVRGDVSLLVEVCDLANAICAPNLRPWLGSLFEKLVFYGLCSSSPLTITEYQGKEETVQFVVGEPNFESRKKLDPFTPKDNCCYFTPNMEGADIIANVNKENYFIQCSVAKEITVKKGFWKTAPDDWKPVLLVPKIDAVKKSLEEGNSELASEYKKKKFALADARGILHKTAIDKFMPKREDI